MKVLKFDDEQTPSEQTPNNQQCNKPMQVWSRVVGYYRPVEYWNKGKAEEYKLRKTFKVDKSINSLETKTPKSKSLLATG